MTSASEFSDIFLYISYIDSVGIEPQLASVGVPTDLPLSSIIKVIGKSFPIE